MQSARLIILSYFCVYLKVSIAKYKFYNIFKLYDILNIKKLNTFKIYGFKCVIRVT